MSDDPSIELRPLTGTSGDLVEVQRVLELAPDYADAIQGAAAAIGKRLKVELSA